MPAAARKMEPTTAGPILHLAFELGAKEWKLGFATGPGRPPRIRKTQPGNLTGLEKEVEQAKQRLGVAAEGRVVSCYEAGRDGFWLPCSAKNPIGLDSGGVLCRSGLNLCPSNRFLGDQPADTGDPWFPFGVWTRRQRMASDDQARLGPSRWTRRRT